MDVNDKFSFRDFISPKDDDRMLQEALKEEYFDNGVKSKTEEIAKKMLKMNMTIEVISEITGLSKDKIMHLKES